jgi:hypothetical protein
MRSAHGTAWGALCWLCLAACVSVERSRYPFFIVAGQEGAPKAHQWLLAPMNALSPAPEYLVAPGERVQSEIRTYLESSGRTWATVSLSEVVKHHDRVKLASGDERDDQSDERVGELSRALAAEHDFDVLAFPELVIHPALVQQGRTAV